MSSAHTLAKNIVLMGVKALTISDSTPVSMNDLSSNVLPVKNCLLILILLQFFFQEKDVPSGLSRAEVSLPKIKELNDRVVLSIHKGDLTDEVLSEFTVCVFHPI